MVFTEEPEEIFYTIRGKEDGYVQENEQKNPILQSEGKYTYAKKLKNRAGVWRYYVRRNQHGRMFNPMGMYDEHAENRTAARRAENKYLEVDAKTFRFYVDFLRTKNKAYFLNAERGV